MSRRRNTALHVDALYDEAKSQQRKLTPAERRRVLIYLDEIGENKLTRVELAKLFQVDERTIRKDRERILTDVASTLTPEAQMRIVTRHLSDVESLIVTCRKGLNTNDSGTLGERFYVETILKLLKEKRETYENVGVIRKELGTLNVAEEHWVAEVTPDGALGVHDINDAA